MKHTILLPLLAVISVFAAGCSSVSIDQSSALIGAWRGHVQFTDGAFASVKDLEFMYTFNAGGTMTESSNYDGAPPVPPAYGAWRRIGEKKYEAKYAFYWTKPPANFDEIAKGNGWAPGGHGVLTQEITMSAGGNGFDSTIRLQMYDQSGKPTDPESHATAQATRMGF
jgi:hypothetical protein